ncbi:hypothetical protein [Micromonospora sp. CPCC 205561]|uniref:hypothetical protein n=1 Tax=Micromonospora sp. CPCC 205561 TaxID=3122407 RepID=UPI002FEF6F22
MKEPEFIRPDAARDEVAFLDLMRQLKDRSGQTFRQLEKAAERHGDYLPRSTVADVLRRQALPRADIVAAFVRACAGEEHVSAWLRAHAQLSQGTPAQQNGSSSLPSVTPGDGAAKPEVGDQLAGVRSTARETVVADKLPRALRRPFAPSILLAMVLATGVGVAVSADDTRRHHGGSLGGSAQNSTETPAPEVSRSGQLPASGWYHLRPAHIADQSLCLGEGRERNGRTDRPLAVQRPCSGVAPDTQLIATTVTGMYEIRWYHPVEGAGCLSVDDAKVASGALLQPTTCLGAPHQRYLLEPVDQPRPGGYRLRPAHSGLCIGALGGVADVDVGAEANQTACTGEADQVFMLQPAARAYRTDVIPPGGR